MRGFIDDGSFTCQKHDKWSESQSAFMRGVIDDPDPREDPHEAVRVSIRVHARLHR